MVVSSFGPADIDLVRARPGTGVEFLRNIPIVWGHNR
jgi:hypothetical protein